MLHQLFRSLGAGSLAIFLAAALVLRAAAFAHDGGAAGEAAPALGPWGRWLAGGWARGGALDWLVGSGLLAGLGYVASYTPQEYRLGVAGGFPGLVAVTLGSAAAWWLGFSPLIAGALALALAAQRLFAGYRYQGASLPVYDCGLWVGAAWLVAPGFAWMGLWGALAIAQLRRFRLRDLLGLALGIATLPFLAGTYAYVVADALPAFRQTLTAGLASPPDPAVLGASWPWIAVTALATGAAVGAFRILTTRRPIQEQRAARMWYAMLAVGWVAMLWTGDGHPWGLAYVLYPLAVLLGLWLGELTRERTDIVGVVVLALIGAGHLAYAYL